MKIKSIGIDVNRIKNLTEWSAILDVMINIGSEDAPILSHNRVIISPKEQLRAVKVKVLGVFSI